MATLPIGKYWLRGAPLPGIDQAEQTGGLTYWLGGLPLPVLNSYTGPPTPPPPGSGALPRGIRLAALDLDDDWRAPSLRRFAPPQVAVLTAPLRPRADRFDEESFFPAPRRAFAPIFPIVSDDGYTYVVF